MTDIQRTPFYFQSQDAWLFAWLHRGDSSTPSRRGIVICSPLGYEQVHSHRSLRHLADALAAAGFPVMRLDYHGTGDSAGIDEDPDRHATWLANIRSAIHWMCAELGCVEIDLVGLRLGATLAAQVAVEESVSGLVLWAPVVKGRAYVREMKALGMTASTAPSANREMTSIEAAGFVLTEQTAKDLAAIDLLQTRPQCRRALIVTRDDLPADNVLLDHLLSLGIEARQTIQPGYSGMTAEPHFTKVPHAAIAEIVAWEIETDKKTRRQGDKETDKFDDQVNANSSSCLSVTLSSCLLVPLPVRERAVRFCHDPDLFAIVSEPSAPPSPELPTIVMLNAGAAYRVGPNRLYVLLARRLAGLGFRCLRMDINGLGDSVTTNPRDENNTYAASAFRDIDLAMKFLKSDLGVGRVILLGLCSGAYASFQSAVQCADPMLVECVVINPLTFYWNEGMQIESAESLKFKAYHDSMESVRQPGKWLKLLTGRSKLGIGGALRIVIDRWKLRQQRRQGDKETRRQGNTDGQAGSLPLCLPSHPRDNDLPGDLKRIVKHGRPLTFFFSRSDPGHDMLTFAARCETDEMCRTGQMKIYFIDNGDHTFSQRAAREAFFQAVVAHLLNGYRQQSF